MVRKDIKVKYAQTNLGVLLSLLQPVVGLFVFTFFFGNLLKIGSDGSPYPVFVFIGMSTWYYFSILVSSSGISLIESQQIIKKVYFPKLIIPVSKAFSTLVEYAIWLIVLIVLLAFYGIMPTYRIIFFPVFILLNMLNGLTFGVWLSALSFRRRDFLHVVPYFVGLIMMVTPVFYPVSIIPQHLTFFLYFNPIAGVVEGLRWCVTGSGPFSLYYIPGFMFVILMFFLSAIYFKNVEYRMAEQL